MSDGHFELPPALQQDLRSLLHDVRGSIGIVSSTMELLMQEDMHPVAMKYLQIVQRQMYRVLMESELFGLFMDPRLEMFAPEPTLALSVLTEVQDLIGTNLEVEAKSPSDSPVVGISPYLLKLVALAILIPPSGLDPSRPVIWQQEGNNWVFLFPWGSAATMLPKFHWARSILHHHSCELVMRPSRLALLCPVYS